MNNEDVNYIIKLLQSIDNRLYQLIMNLGSSSVLFPETESAESGEKKQGS